MSRATSRRYNTAPNSGPGGAQAIAAEQETQSPAHDTLETTFIVDADVHVHESPTEMAEYAADPWDVALREIGKVDERYLDLPGMSPLTEISDTLGTHSNFTFPQDSASPSQDQAQEIQSTHR